jgi:glycosyltransferase involved in cell wall biosynthesis
MLPQTRTAGKAATAEREIPVSSAPSGPLSALWVSWNAHRRTTGLCAEWNLPLHVIPHARGRLFQRLRWFEQAGRTLALLRRTNPAILFVQNPSLLLSTLALASRRYFGYTLVVDAHNEGVRPFMRPGRFVAWLTRRLLKGADATIVTNPALEKDVTAAGGRALVLPDRMPAPELPAKAAAINKATLVAVISTFLPDEPVAAIVAAATTLPEVHFAFTGDVRRFRHKDIELPSNVRLTGYLADEAFWKLLAQADVICDLTLKPDCLVCGAYEALALAKPMVLSDNPATREIFGSAAVLTDNSAAGIACAVATAVEQRERLEANAQILRAGYPATWQVQAASVWAAICADATATRPIASNRAP